MNIVVSMISHYVKGDQLCEHGRRTMIKLGPAPSPAFFFSPGLGFLFFGEPEPAAGRHRNA